VLPASIRQALTDENGRAERAGRARGVRARGAEQQVDPARTEVPSRSPWSAPGTWAWSLSSLASLGREVAGLDSDPEMIGSLPRGEAPVLALAHRVDMPE
jgi:hypothetical protein